jgi:hypothetical protein
MAQPLAVELTIEGCRPDDNPRVALVFFTDVPPGISTPVDTKHRDTR